MKTLRNFWILLMLLILPGGLIILFIGLIAKRSPRLKEWVDKALK
jgi:hypothetical protein